jgi:hypothetical protein
MAKRGVAAGASAGDPIPLSRFGALVAQLESVVASARQKPPDALLCFDLLSELSSALDEAPKVRRPALLSHTTFQIPAAAALPTRMLLPYELPGWVSGAQPMVLLCRDLLELAHRKLQFR